MAAICDHAVIGSIAKGLATCVLHCHSPPPPPPPFHVYNIIYRRYAHNIYSSQLNIVFCLHITMVYTDHASPCIRISDNAPCMWECQREALDGASTCMHAPTSV